MAKQKDTGKTSTLSQEYVVDSDSDDLAAAEPSVHKDPRTENRERSLKRKQKKDQTPSSPSVARAQAPGDDDLLNDQSDATDSPSVRADSSSNEEASGNAAPAQAVQKPGKKRKASTADALPIVVAAKPFRVPFGFEEIQPDMIQSGSDALGTLSGDLGGKQVWHITAPSSVPLSSIGVLNVDEMRSGKPVLVHKKKQYGFSTESHHSAKLLIPRQNGSTYKWLNTPISMSYHLREISSNSQSNGSEEKQPDEAIEFFAKEPLKTKAAPQQPELLRMRYKPFGTDDSLLGPRSLNDDVAAKESSRESASLAASSPHKSTPKKRKKEKLKQPRSNEPDEMDIDPAQTDGAHAGTKVAQEPISQIDASRPNLSTSTNGVGEDTAIPGKKKKKRKSREESSS